MKKQIPYACKVLVFFFSAMFLLAEGPALAEGIDTIEVSSGETSLRANNYLGLGVAFLPDYEGSEDYTAAPLLQARFNFSNKMYFDLLGNSARFNLIPSHTWNFGPLLRYRAERDDVDNDRVDRLEDVDAAVELGAYLSYNPQNWSFLISAAQDVADAHDGYVVGLSAGYRIQLQERTVMTLFATSNYASEDYMDTYFGIDQADADRSGLSTFDADSEWKDVGGGVLLNHLFESRWGMMGVIKYDKLLGDASDSPIVDDEGDDNQWLLGALVNYRF